MANRISDPYLDTDIIIRFLTSDDLKKQHAVARLFEKVVDGKIILKAPATVIADAVYVLSSSRLYDLPRTTVRDVLISFLRPANFKITNKQALVSTLDLWETTHLDFGDAFLICLTRQSDEKTLYSFDQDFDRYKDIKRLEP